MQFFAFLLELFESIIAESTSTIRAFIVQPTLGYIRWLTAFVWIPEIIDITIYRDLVKYHWRIFPATAIVAVAIAIPWDYYGIRDGVWGFPGSIIGVYFLNIPLEEYLYFIFTTWFLVLVFLFFYKVEERRNVRQI